MITFRETHRSVCHAYVCVVTEVLWIYISLTLKDVPHCCTVCSCVAQSPSELHVRLLSASVWLLPCRYCNQVLNKEIDESVTLLLQELVRFQERVYQKDPSKAKAKRRLVMGLREVTKHMKLHKIKCVLISPNCEKIQAKGQSAMFSSAVVTHRLGNQQTQMNLLWGLSTK